MASTYEAISSQTLSSSTNTVSFSSISGAYTDLRLVFQSRTDRTASTVEAVSLRFNDDSTTTYSHLRMLANSSTTFADRSANLTAASGGRINTSVSSNTVMSTHIVDILSYSKSGVYKTILTSSSGNSSQIYFIDRTISLWRSTSAITKITMLPALGPNFVSGSTFVLYGIKAN